MRNRPIPNIPEHDRAFVRGLLIDEDEGVLAFNKPSGLPSQVRGNRARNLDHLLWTFARSNGKRPRLVHRLDSGTSGIILAAKTQPDAVALSAQFEARSASKTYVALVRGRLTGEAGQIDAPIARLDDTGRSKIVVGHPSGKPARTHWRKRHGAEAAHVLEVRPKTGRMHQIRVHLAYLGVPIVGDQLYGGMPASRLALHAMDLTVAHPRKKAPVTYSAPIPDDFIELASQYGISPAVFQSGSLL